MIKVEATTSIKHISRNTFSTSAVNLEMRHISTPRLRDASRKLPRRSLSARILPQHSHMVARYRAQAFLHGGVLALVSFDQITQHRH